MIGTEWYLLYSNLCCRLLCILLFLKGPWNNRKFWKLQCATIKARTHLWNTQSWTFSLRKLLHFLHHIASPIAKILVYYSLRCKGWFFWCNNMFSCFHGKKLRSSHYPRKQKKRGGKQELVNLLHTGMNIIKSTIK